MTNRLLPVNASMKSATSSRSAMPRRESAASCRPAIQPSVRSSSAVHVGGGELQPHHPVEELPRLGRGEAEVGGAQLGELPATAQPGQRQRRIGAGRHDQMQLIRKVVEQEGHRLVDLGRFDRVVVVEHHDPLLLRLVLAGSSDVVDERGQGGGRRGGGQRLEDGRVDIELGALQGGHQVGHEAGQVVVAVIEGEPPDPCVSLPLIEVGEPVAEQGGLAEAGRRGHQSQPMARIESGVEPLGDSGSGDELRAPSRHEQLGGQNRSRHHHRMIEAQDLRYADYERRGHRPDGTASSGLINAMRGPGRAMGLDVASFLGRCACSRLRAAAGDSSGPQ